MSEARQRRITVRQGNQIVSEPLDKRISQALASHRLLLASTGRADRILNASQGAGGRSRVMMTVPDGLTGCSTSMFKVTIHLNQSIPDHQYLIGSTVRKVIQGGPAGQSINAMDEDNPENNVFRIMESRTEAPIPRSVMEDLNFQGIVVAGASLLRGHMPTVDVQVWAYEFAEQLVNWAAHANPPGERQGRTSPLGAQLAVDMTAAREILPGLNAWVMAKAMSDFCDDQAHYINNPINCLADLVIVHFCSELGVQ